MLLITVFVVVIFRLLAFCSTFYVQINDIHVLSMFSPTHPERESSLEPHRYTDTHI